MGIYDVYEIISSCMDDYTVLFLTNNGPSMVIGVLRASPWMSSYFHITLTPQAEFINFIQNRISHYFDLTSCALRVIRFIAVYLAFCLGIQFFTPETAFSSVLFSVLYVGPFFFSLGFSDIIMGHVLL